MIDLIQHQKLLDRLNQATENLRQAVRDKIRAQDQEEYWQKQINNLTMLLEKDRADE